MGPITIIQRLLMRNPPPVAVPQETPRRYGWNEPIPCSETGPLMDWLDHCIEGHEDGGLFAEEGR